jgi:transposase, IS5 family
MKKGENGQKPCMRARMYRRPAPGQLSFENFYLPFGGKLKGSNRWVKLSEFMPWEELEESYAEQFSERMGAPAKSFRVALGSLIIKEKLGTSDEETVEQIRENPYLQYFLGFSEYRDEAPFDSSMLVHFRKRLNLEILTKANEVVAKKIFGIEEASPQEKEPSKEKSREDAQENKDEDPPPPPNKGQLVMDATCAPADIRYPTDLGLLNEAREASEAILDVLYEQVRELFPVKPRTHRNLARKAYLTVAKQRKPKSKVIRKGIRKQLNYLGRNLRHIDGLMAAGASLLPLSQRLYRLLLVSCEVYRQQLVMYKAKTRRIDDRIVSLSQPHVRPIVRGKAGVPVEFGAKLSVSCVQGVVFLDRLSWDNFNESTHLQEQVEAFYRRFGHYPESVHADQIYRTRANRSYCKARGIRLSGPPLGRRKEDPEVQSQLKHQAKLDEAVRVWIEGKFGQAKRRFSLARVMTKLAETSESAIAVTFLVLNLERWLQLLLSFLFGLSSLHSSSLKVLLALCKTFFLGLGQLKLFFASLPPVRYSLTLTHLTNSRFFISAA